MRAFWSAIKAWIKRLFAAPVVVPQPTPEPVVVPPAPNPVKPLNPDLKSMWDKCTISRYRGPEIARAVNLILQNIEVYKRIELETGVPAFVIGAIHYRESSLNFRTHLHNGDPLSKRTTHVPAGRPLEEPDTKDGYSWEFSALDAIRYDGLDKVKSWDIATMLDACERYNGLGYRRRGINSPYLWNYTDLYTRGQYTSDGVFDPNKIDGQSGVVPILKALWPLKV